MWGQLCSQEQWKKKEKEPNTTHPGPTLSRIRHSNTNDTFNHLWPAREDEKLHILKTLLQAGSCCCCCCTAGYPALPVTHRRHRSICASCPGSHRSTVPLSALLCAHAEKCQSMCLFSEQSFQSLHLCCAAPDRGAIEMNAAIRQKEARA